MEEIRHVEVADMLRARDERAMRQRELLEKYGAPLVSFTMNIAGSIKNNRWIRRAFLEGVRRIERQLERAEFAVLDCVKVDACTGCEALWAVRANAAALKARMCIVEEADALGRLFDVDVLDEHGEHLSRGSERKCLICGQNVRACARSRAHSADELFEKAHEIVAQFFREQFTLCVAETAQRALLWEAITTPKPGLVDRENSGAHRDMDLFHFLDSACALREYFAECVRIGQTGGDFVRLQYSGQDAEDAMRRAAGVNTHKGAIFSLGILCCAVGICGEGAGREAILERAASLGQCAMADFGSMQAARTGGEWQYRQYGLTGARGEAASGFASVQKIALPALERAISEGKSLEEAGLHALLALMAQVQDSNIIRRSGMEGQAWAQAQARALLATGFSQDDLRRMNERFVEKNISPGGSADLLAVTYFLWFLEQKDC